MTKRILSCIISVTLLCTMVGILTVCAAEKHRVTFIRRDGATMTWQVRDGQPLDGFPDVPKWIKDEQGQVLVITGWLVGDSQGRWRPYYKDSPVHEDLRLKPQYSFGIIKPNDAKMIAYTPVERPGIYLSTGRDAWISLYADGKTRRADQLEWYLMDDDIARLVTYDDGRVSVIGKAEGSTFLCCYDTVTKTTTHRYVFVVKGS